MTNETTSAPTDRLYGKFRVERADGRDKPGGDKAGARYFVLDYAHDEHARAALKAYADACERDEPGLAADLRRALAATVAPPPPCGFCGRVASHVEADHPLPKTHPDYDAFYDASDDELAGMVSESFGEVSR